MLVNQYAGITVYRRKILNYPRNGTQPRTEILHQRMLQPATIRKLGGSVEKGMNGKPLLGAELRELDALIGLYASEENNLQVINPKLAEEWHPVKNGGLTPKNVLPYSKDRVWWRCQKAHDWQAPVASRTKGRGCPVCSGRIATKEYNLQVVNPILAEQWHPTKNGDLTPKDVLPGAHKKEVVAMR